MHISLCAHVVEPFHSQLIGTCVLISHVLVRCLMSRYYRMVPSFCVWAVIEEFGALVQLVVLYEGEREV